MDTAVVDAAGAGLYGPGYIGAGDRGEHLVQASSYGGGVAAELEKLREESPDMSLPDIFADWESGYGFGSEIWPCFEEFLDCEYKERMACGHDEQ